MTDCFDSVGCMIQMYYVAYIFMTDCFDSVCCMIERASNLQKIPGVTAEKLVDKII